jgi:hypothetical protein
MSWPAVRSLHQLATDADVVAVGTVTSAEPGQVTDQFARVDGIRVGMPFTVSSIAVEHALAGAERAGGIVGVWQEGAEGMPILTSTTYTLLQAGRRYLLFLAYDESSGAFRSVGGPQGMYQIIGERVLSLDGTEHGAPPWLLGQSVDRAAELIAEALE